MRKFSIAKSATALAMLATVGAGALQVAVDEIRRMQNAGNRGQGSKRHVGLESAEEAVGRPVGKTGQENPVGIDLPTLTDEVQHRAERSRIHVWPLKGPGAAS